MYYILNLAFNPHHSSQTPSEVMELVLSEKQLLYMCEEGAGSGVTTPDYLPIYIHRHLHHACTHTYRQTNTHKYVRILPVPHRSAVFRRGSHCLLSSVKRLLR
jgi:hypothetical protein